MLCMLITGLLSQWSCCVIADEAAEAGIKGLVQIRVEGGAPQAPKAITEGLSSQQIDDILRLCEAQEVGPFTWACCLTSDLPSS